eukprot:gene7937-9467_t
MSIPASQLAHAFKPLSVLSWNVNGLRSFLKHDPTGNVLRSLLTSRKVDVLCLQETKIQASHQEELAFELTSKFGVSRSYWSSSTARKGYSGTAVLMFDKLSNNEVVTNGIGDVLGDSEGRAITIETDRYSLVNTYVPNSGPELAKLDYRTSTWDAQLARHINQLKAKRPHLPVILTGDLNVAHGARDYYNPHEPRTKKQAGTTPQEQASFGTTLLQGCTLVDSFRAQYPTTRTFSYFGSRLGERGRKEKLGMRLDYVVLSQPLAPALGAAPIKFDTYIEDEISHPYSDHCPVGAVFEL